MDQNQTDDVEAEFEPNYEGECLEKIGEESEDEYSSGSDYVTGMSHADKKKHHLEYAHLLKEIANQNRTVDLLKEKLMGMCSKGSLSKCELQEIKKIRACMENENLKLQCLIRKAIQMQNEYPIRSWEEVPIVTTIEDDVFPHISNVMAVLGLAPEQVADQEKSGGGGGGCCGGCSSSKEDKCKPKPDETDKEICHLAEEMALKDKMLECLKEKLRLLQCHSKILEQTSSCGKKPPGCGCAEDNIENMKCTVDKLKSEIICLCREKEDSLRKQAQCYADRQFPELAPHPNTIEMRKLENYPPFPIKYEKKPQTKGHCLERYTNDPSRKQTCPCADSMSMSNTECELKRLREKVKELCDEQEEYTSIIKEQAEQLDGYRKQYLCAQQIVEDQKAMLDKIDMSKKCIEGQIQAEVARINAKLEEQLCELSRYPKLLENEQAKLATACKDREDLEDKLRVLCKELKTVKEQIAKHAEAKRCERRKKKKRPTCSTNSIKI